MRRITAREYFDYINKRIDNMTDEELLQLLEEIENSKEDTPEDFCYDFEMVCPVEVNTNEIGNNDFISNLNLEWDIYYSTRPCYIFGNNEQINIDDSNVRQKVA